MSRQVEKKLDRGGGGGGGGGRFHPFEAEKKLERCEDKEPVRKKNNWNNGRAGKGKTLFKGRLQAD